MSGSSGEQEQTNVQQREPAESRTVDQEAGEGTIGHEHVAAIRHGESKDVRSAVEVNESGVEGHESGHASSDAIGELSEGASEPSEGASPGRDVQQEASEHLAQRAAEMSIESQNAPAGAADKSSGVNSEVSPGEVPPAVVPSKENGKKPVHVETEYDEKHPPDEESGPDMPEAREGAADATGAELQDIMDQFENGMGGLDEQEIMSPRLERQQPAFVLPPRSSSLENRDSPTLSPQTTGQSIKSQSSIDRASGPPPFRKSGDDAESIRSAKAGSIFQPPPPSPEPEATLPFDFHRFLEQLRHRTADPVARFLRSFLAEFGKKQWAVHEQVKIISDFLEFISKKMSQCEVWRTVSDAEFDNAREGMEKLVMNRLFSHTFSPAIPPAAGSPRKAGRGGRSPADVASPHGPGRRGQHQEDVERDDVIAQKIRIYGWISEDHLDIKQLGDKGRKFMGLAQQELLKINSYRAPRDKVICVLNCCKVIFGYLKSARADQSADAFVPLLIYIVLRARPEHLVSNVQYIWRFRNQDKLGGEAGYYMSSLMGVVSFIENLDRTNLTISDEEFERHVEEAVSAIAEENKEQDYEDKSHAAANAARPMQHLTEKSALSRPEVTPRNSVDAERSSPRRNVGQRLSEKSQQPPASTDDDDSDAVTGLLRTIQKPLSSIGRMFSDDGGDQRQSSLKPTGTSQLASTPRGLSPAPALPRRPSADSRANQRPSGERQRSQPQNANDAAARQASAEAAEAQRLRVKEHKVVVETLQSMFPNLDKEVIEDVTRAQEGNVGRAVDACLALSG